MALIGSPVAHSGSPAMYNYSFARLGLDYVYVAFDVKKEETGEAIKAMRLFGIRGMNVTMPCKGEALTYMDKLSPAARLMGAVNTIVNDNGVLTGYNTDGAGFVRNLKEHGISVQGKCITLAGGGGAATAIQVQCALDGAKEIRVFNRRAHTREMAERVAAEAPGCRITVSDIADGDALRESIASSGIFINATSVGMKPMDGESVIKDTSVFRPDLAVADVVYNPAWTRLLREASQAGCTCVDGRGMLLWQGVEAFKLYTGLDMPVDEVRERFFKE